MERKVCMLGGGMSPWGVRQATLRDLFQEAGKAAFEDVPGLTNKDIDGLLVASAYTERINYQTHLAPLVAEYLGIRPTSVCARVELLCASGSSAIILATGLIASGMADVVMVAGGDKLNTPQRWEAFYSQLASVDHDWDGAMGLGLPPAAFAMVAKLHMREYGTTEEQLALVSVKNRRNGLNNPKGQFQREVCLEDCMTARTIVWPMKLNDCCPLTDGAAAIILAEESKAREFAGGRPLVYLKATAQATVNNMSANQPSWTTWQALKTAAARAYGIAGITPDHIDVAQTHDCFTVSEIIEYEDLGFCAKGEGGPFVESGQSDFGGKVPVNTDGGLLSCGHPFGGTGIRQGMEITRQLQGRAARQVEGATWGLTHNLSGFIAAQTVLIYSTEA